MDLSSESFQASNERPSPTELRWKRLWHLVGHPIHLTLASVALAVGILLASPWGLVTSILLLEALVVGVLPRVPAVRSWTDRQLRDRRRRRARAVRNALVPSMDPGHTDELAELEHRASEARDHAARLGARTEALLDDWLDLDELLESYVRLSVANREVRESLLVTNRRQLLFELGRLREERERASNERVRSLVDRDIALLHRRLECLEHREREREIISGELSSVATLCRLVHERVCVLSHPSSLSSEVERIISEVQLHDEVLAETLGSVSEEDEQEDGEADVPARVRVAEDDEDGSSERRGSKRREERRRSMRRAGSLAS